MRKIVSVSLTPELKEILDAEVKKHQLSSRSECVRRMIRDWKFVQREKIRLQGVRHRLEDQQLWQISSLTDLFDLDPPEGNPLTQ